MACTQGCVRCDVFVIADKETDTELCRYELDGQDGQIQWHIQQDIPNSYLLQIPILISEKITSLQTNELDRDILFTSP